MSISETRQKPITLEEFTESLDQYLDCFKLAQQKLSKDFEDPSISEVLSVMEQVQLLTDQKRAVAEREEKLNYGFNK